MALKLPKRAGHRWKSVSSGSVNAAGWEYGSVVHTPRVRIVVNAGRTPQHLDLVFPVCIPGSPMPLQAGSLRASRGEAIAGSGSETPYGGPETPRSGPEAPCFGSQTTCRAFV